MRRTGLFLAAFLTATSAIGHSFYSPLCCSDKDCKPIKNVEVKATPAGWQIVITGEVLSYSDSRIKQSPDGAFHRCASAADFSADGLTLCLYVPDQVG